MKTKYKLILFTALTSSLSLLVFNVVKPMVANGGVSITPNGSNSNQSVSPEPVTQDHASVSPQVPDPTQVPVATQQPVQGTQAPAPNNQQCTTVCVQEKLVCN